MYSHKIRWVEQWDIGANELLYYENNELRKLIVMITETNATTEIIWCMIVHELDCIYFHILLLFTFNLCNFIWKTKGNPDDDLIKINKKWPPRS